MARFNMNEAENYGSTMQGGFFSLKNDKDTARVRFMYNTIEDVEGYSVHEIQVDGKKRYVNCLRAYNEPVDNCPLCAAKYKVHAKLFLHLYNLDTDEIQVWDRGKTFFSTVASLCARYNPLVSTPIEIERNGKKGDTKTTYMPYAMETDDITLEDLPEIQPILGGLVLDKTYEEILNYLETGDFGDEEGQPQEQLERNPAVRPRPQAAAQTSPPQTRRTPANTSPTTPARSRRTNGPVDKF